MKTENFKAIAAAIYTYVDYSISGVSLVVGIWLFIFIISTSHRKNLNLVSIVIIVIVNATCNILFCYWH